MNIVKTDQRYNDGSIKYIHQCSCGNDTYLGTKNKTNGNCKSCLTIARSNAARQVKNHNPMINWPKYQLGQGILTQESIREVFDYKDGELIYKFDMHSKAKAGAIAGSYNSIGYKMVSIHKVKYLIHRLIYIFHNGQIAHKKIVDHKDRNTRNNNIANLRLLDHVHNMWNNGAKGYTYVKKLKKYKAQIKRHGKQTTIGYFDTSTDAHEAYIEAKLTYHKEIYDE